MVQPKIAVIEMGQTCSKNYERAINLLRAWDVDHMQAKLAEYADKVKMLNMRTEQPVTGENVVDAMKCHATNEEQSLSLMDDLEIVGNTFFATAMHLKTLRAIICNPAVYAQKLHMENREDADLKEDPKERGVHKRSCYCKHASSSSVH